MTSRQYYNLQSVIYNLCLKSTISNLQSGIYIFVPFVVNNLQPVDKKLDNLLYMW